MLYGYFDDSGTHDSLVVTMAGYVASQEGWAEFEGATEELFRKEGISIFHATKFVHGKGEFRGWRNRREKFASDWFEIANRTLLCGLTISVNKDDFERAKAKGSVLENTSSFGFCLLVIVEKLFTSIEMKTLIVDEGISLTLEASGTRREVGVGVALEQFTRCNDLGETVRFSGVKGKSELRALQLADYLAHFSWKQAELAAAGRLRSRSSFLDVSLNSVPTCIALTQDYIPNPGYPKWKAKGLASALRP